MKNKNIRKYSVEFFKKEFNFTYFRSNPYGHPYSRKRKQICVHMGGLMRGVNFCYRELVKLPKHQEYVVEA